ncbi:putative pectinesterase/pectinesterase inhibitor 47 [Sesamum angolense]|uniref:Pectinesterase n=1 Tax=Sesamum angolense TaxID=2727404 RepID=A0AAE1XGA5_9LAMI|nr:putative pectinesterase/pectinesterase inhibitor 47 [Sesamum angolense]
MPNPNPLCTLLFSSLFILSLAPPPLSAQSPPQSPSSACKSTLYPKLCLSILSAFQHSPASSDNYSNALNDCHHLQELNVDYLELISSELKTAENMSDVLVGRVQSLLSAVVTNQQTCFDGLADAGSGIARALAAPLGDAAAMYSASLGLVMHALGSGRRRRRGGGGVSGRRGAMELDWARLPTSVLIEFLHESEESPKGRRLLGELDMDGGIHVNDSVTVSPYGGGNFTTINDAIAFAPNNSDGYFIIYAMQGYYEEYVVVPRNKKNIMLIGDGINSTVITGNRSVIDGWTTFNSATFVVSGERFVAIDIAFKNTAGPEKHQAVAVRNNADLSTFYRCSFEGYQDTLYTHSLRQFYRECDIYGTVDFIFGNAAAVFQNCNLFARKPMPNQKVAFTAQGRTDPNQNTGISIHNCTIGAAADLAMDLNSSNLSTNYLGRPWKEYSRTVYMQSYIGSLINPVGWLEWNGTKGLDTLYYGEYENYGPGADTSMRVQWPGYSLMNASDAFNFTVYNLTMGDTWLPDTTIPFSAGLLQH